ncbi:MAG: helix-turn-helix domain-containing protein [Bacillota bacterium]
MSGMINSNIENNERGLLPYLIILAANKGEPEAMKVVVLHYGSYMTSLSMRKLRDEQGNTYWGIDEDTRERLQAKLMQSVLAFKI